MSTRKFIVAPAIAGSVTIGSRGDNERVLLGRLAETGANRDVFISADQEFVALVVGKRGSGKSYTLGNILEGFATTGATTPISDHHRRRGVLLLDPMGNFWTMMQPVDPHGTPKVAEQHGLAAAWPLSIEPINVGVWLPAGFRTQYDSPQVQDFSIRVQDLEPSDLADLVGANLLTDPQGAAISDAYEAVVMNGWLGPNGMVPPQPAFTLADLIDYLDDLKQTHGGGDHAAMTLKALIRSLRSLARQPVFSSAGTPLTDLFSEGKLNILMLPHRVGEDLRRVITRLILRRTLREREEASQIRQRLSVEQLDPATKASLQAELARRIPRGLLALDEAQELLGEEGGEARKAIEDFCLLGRNYGLSLVLATQRPTAGAISARVKSQADIQLIHRLLTQDDIRSAHDNLLGTYPDEIRSGGRQLDFAALVRSLDRGQMIVSSSFAQADENVTRIMVAQSRPRVTVHGGEVE